MGKVPFDLLTLGLLVGHGGVWLLVAAYPTSERAPAVLARTVHAHAFAGACVIGVLVALSLLGWLFEFAIARKTARRRVVGSVGHGLHTTANFALVSVLAAQALWALTIASSDWGLNDPVWIPDFVPRLASFLSIGVILGANMVLAHALTTLAAEAWSIFRTIYGALLVARDYPRLGAATTAWHRASDGEPDPLHVTILAISDTHIRRADEATLEAGAAPLGELSASIAQWIAAHTPSLLVHCGDVTDVGSKEDAAAAISVFREIAVATPHVKRLFAPGNHDIHFKTASDDSRSWYGTHEARRVAAWLGTLWNPPPPWQSDPGHEPGYPQLVVVDLAIPIRVLLLDSNRRPSNSVTTNALGYVGEEQLAQATGMLRVTAACESPLVIVLHHHVGLPASRPKESLFDRVTAQALVCLDADRILTFAHEYHAIAVLHGHQHQPFIATHRENGHDLVVVSCGSARYAAKGPCKDAVQHPSCAVLRVGHRGLLSATCEVARAPAVEPASTNCDAAIELPEIRDSYRMPAGMSDGMSRFARIPYSLLRFLIPIVLYVAAGLITGAPLVANDAPTAPLYTKPSAQLVVRDLVRYLAVTCDDNEPARDGLRALSRETDPSLFDQGLIHFARNALHENVFAYAPFAWRISRMIAPSSPAFPDAQQLQLDLTGGVGSYIYHRLWSSRSSCVVQGDPLEDPPLR